MLLIDIQDQRRQSAVPLSIEEQGLAELLEACGETYDTPLELKVRIRDARSFDDTGQVRPLDESLTTFRLVLYVLPYKTELSEAARRVLNRNITHNCVHVVQVRAQGTEMFRSMGVQNEIEAVIASRALGVEVVR